MQEARDDPAGDQAIPWRRLEARGRGVLVTVVSLAAARQEREPHWQGECICLACKHTWQGVGPMGKISGLECPSCGVPQGHTRWPFGAPEGAAYLLCKCGSEAMTAYKYAGRFYVKCMACGTDQTELFYDG